MNDKNLKKRSANFSAEQQILERFEHPLPDLDFALYQIHCQTTHSNSKNSAGISVAQCITAWKEWGFTWNIVTVQCHKYEKWARPQKSPQTNSITHHSSSSFLYFLSYFIDLTPSYPFPPLSVLILFSSSFFHLCIPFPTECPSYARIPMKAHQSQLSVFKEHISIFMGGPAPKQVIVMQCDIYNGNDIYNVSKGKLRKGT